MLANKLNTVRIVVGSDGASSDKSTNAADEFRNRFVTAYKHDVEYWNGKEGIGGYPSADEIAATVRLASTQGKRFDPAENYKDINKLPETVRELVLELSSTKCIQECIVTIVYRGSVVVYVLFTGNGLWTRTEDCDRWNLVCNLYSYHTYVE